MLLDRLTPENITEQEQLPKMDYGVRKLLLGAEGSFEHVEEEQRDMSAYLRQ